MVGIAASLGLLFGWDFESRIDGKLRSTGLFICVFFLSLVDCTSSVLYFPYIGHFKQIYLNSFLIGEGLSGFVPAVVSLVQGVGGNPVCITLENGTSYLQSATEQARFSPSVFFAFLTLMICFSFFAFLLLHNLPVSKSEKIDKLSNTSTPLPTQNSDFNNEDTESLESFSQQLITKQPIPTHNFFLLLLVQSFICFLTNGALPSIQTYSCLPYGKLIIFNFFYVLHFR